MEHVTFEDMTMALILFFIIGLIIGTVLGIGFKVYRHYTKR